MDFPKLLSVSARKNCPTLKAIKETIAYNRMYQEAYEKWLNAHKKENCDKK